LREDGRSRRVVAVESGSLEKKEEKEEGEDRLKRQGERNSQRRVLEKKRPIGKTREKKTAKEIN
jgi:DNA-binding protein H-NS